MIQQYWRAEVYSDNNDDPEEMVIRKFFAGIYASRKSAEFAAKQLCGQVKGFGFYLQALDKPYLSG